MESGWMGGCILLIAVAGGCASVAPAAPSLPGSGWIKSEGGLAGGPENVRVVAIASTLAQETFHDPITVRVLASDVPGGYAWPGGAIFVTRGLLQVVNDDELAAAIAHEMGHLLADEGPPGLVALAGQSACREGCESKADAMGCLILRVHGRPTDAMASLLAKVQASPMTEPAVRRAIARRIEILHAHREN